MNDNGSREGNRGGTGAAISNEDDMDSAANTVVVVKLEDEKVIEPEVVVPNSAQNEG